MCVHCLGLGKTLFSRLSHEERHKSAFVHCHLSTRNSRAPVHAWVKFFVVYMSPTFVLENVEHCGGEPEQVANGFDIQFATRKIV